MTEQAFWPHDGPCGTDGGCAAMPGCRCSFFDTDQAMPTDTEQAFCPNPFDEHTRMWADEIWQHEAD